MANLDDARLEYLLPLAAPAVVDIAATSSGYTPLVLPAGVDAAAQSYRLRIEPVAVDYTVRFGSETTGFKVLAGQTFEIGPLVRSALPSIKLASTSATVRCLVSWPSRA